ncbi:MAG: glutathione S-transferase family protein [Rhodospirillaceae bacterium]|nr:glutathione S-transferase family protein [Rhodospirillaceae bacterium]
MAPLKLIVGNKAYSSWSLRAWLGVAVTGADFEEVVVALDHADTHERILSQSPSGKVPALHIDGVVVWESLAILEVLAERFPAAGLLPEEWEARAVARAVAAEMHAGFAPLRRDMPMDLKRMRHGEGKTPDALADVRRVTEIWCDCRRRFGADGPFLLGGFTLADAMYAPVVTRFHTYGVTLDPVSQAYCTAIEELAAMKTWRHAAVAEPWTLERP